MAVYVDLLGTGELSESDEGTQLTLEYMVTGVTGNEFTRRTAALANGSIPRQGAQAPGVPGLRVVERRVIPVSGSPTKFIVRVRYETPDAASGRIDRTQRYGPVRWSGAGRNTTETTVTDWRGTPMRVYYAGKPVLSILSIGTGEIEDRTPFIGTVKQAELAEAQRDLALLQLRAERWERDDPEPRARVFGNKTNSQSWRGYDPITVISNEMTFDPDPNGGWNCQYSFTYNPAGWRYLNAIRLYKQIPQDATVGNGIEYHDIYEPVAFTQWEL